MEYAENRFEWMAKIIIYIFAALLPVLVMPLPLNIEFGREVAFGTLIILATIFWLLGILTKGTFRIQRSPLMIFGGILLIILAASTLASKTPYASFMINEPLGERTFLAVLALLLTFVAGSVISSKKEVKKILLLLVGTGALGGLIGAFSLYLQKPILQFIFSVFAAPETNPVGTSNGLALIYVVYLAIALGLLSGEKRRTTQYFLIASSAVFLVNLLLINYFFSWIAFIGFSIPLLGLGLKDARTRGAGLSKWFALFGVLVAGAIVMLLVRSPLVGSINLPAEVTPSFGATYQVAQHVFSEGPRSALLGSGPATFGTDWLRYKSQEVNQTQFWGVRFNQGFSWLSTALATTGILGFFALILFFFVAFFLFLPALLSGSIEENSIIVALFSGFIGILICAAVYPATCTVVLLAFFITGLLMSAAAKSDKHDMAMSMNEDGKSGFWSIQSRTIKFGAPWQVFLSSLLSIFLLALGVATLYAQVGRVRAALMVQDGITAFNRGATDEAVNKFNSAIQINNNNYLLYVPLIQTRIEQIRKLIDRAAQGENVQQSFQATVSTAVQESQTMLNLQKYDPDLWELQGSMYELMIPFIGGSERLAFDSYKKAIELNPINPVLYTDLGRAYMVYSERLLAIINQGAPDRDQQVRERKAVLEESVQAFGRAADAKQDYALAHFLNAQALLRLGNVESAIKSVESAKLAAPFDIGIAFQLGLLYYQTNDFSHAQAEFERAVSINDNYSNARYFLGLIYDKQGRKNDAIAQFDKIKSLNPGNQEVEKILENLRVGKAALNGIVPPNVAPEKRKETPVNK